MSYTETVAPEPLGTGGHGPLHSETVGEGHGGAQNALNVANVGNGNKAVNDVFQRNIVFRRTDRTILPK